MQTITTVEPVRVTPAQQKTPRHWPMAMPLMFLLWLCAFLLIEPQPLQALGQNWPLMLVGFGASIVANISAIGGGLVFIPAMMFIYHFPPVAALKIAIGTQSIGMIVGGASWFRTGLVPTRGFKYAVPGLIIGSTLSSLVIHANALLIKGVFGPVSIVLGCLALISLRKSANGGREDIPDSARWPLFAVSILGGLITGWVSIGEGEVIAALLMLAYGVSAKRSIALGVVLLAINSIYLAFNHLVFLGGIPWHTVIFTSGGAIYGAWMAPSISRLISTRTMKILFASVAILDGLLFIYQSCRQGH